MAENFPALSRASPEATPLAPSLLQTHPGSSITQPARCSRVNQRHIPPDSSVYHPSRLARLSHLRITRPNSPRLFRFNINQSLSAKSETSRRRLHRLMATRRPVCQMCGTSTSMMRRVLLPQSSSRSPSVASLCPVWPPRRSQLKHCPTGGRPWVRRRYRLPPCPCRSRVPHLARVKSSTMRWTRKILWCGRSPTCAKSLRHPTVYVATLRTVAPTRCTPIKVPYETASTRLPLLDLELALSVALPHPDLGSTSHHHPPHRGRSRTTEPLTSSPRKGGDPSIWVCRRLPVDTPLLHWPNRWTSSTASRLATRGRASTTRASRKTSSANIRLLVPRRRLRLLQRGHPHQP